MTADRATESLVKDDPLPGNSPPQIDLTLGFSSILLNKATSSVCVSSTKSSIKATYVTKQRP